MGLNILVILPVVWAGLAGLIYALLSSRDMLASSSRHLQVYWSLFLACVSYVIAEGILIVIAGSSFYLDIKIPVLLSVLAGVGVSAWAALGYCWRGKVMSVLFPRLSCQPFLLAEKGIILVIAVLMFFYLYKISIPCSDHDELAMYGNFSKMIANGWMFGNLIPNIDIRPRFFESLDAVFYSVFNDPFGVRAVRLLNLSVCGGMIYSFLRVLSVSRVWSLWSLGAFIGMSELSYLAVSMKVDSILMMFELTGMLLLTFSVVTFFKLSESPLRQHVILSLASLAVLTAGVACLGRTSGGYFLVCSLISITLLFWFTRKESSTRQKYGVVMAVAFGCWALIAAVCILTYRNPLSPLDPPFSLVKDYLRLSINRAAGNIQGLPWGISQVYVIFVMVTGLEWLDKFLHFPSWVPMSKDKLMTVGGWAFPVLSLLAAVPSFWKRSIVVRVMFVIFAYQFIVWSSGIQYSRVFWSSIALMTVMTAVMAKAASIATDAGARQWRQFFQWAAILILAHSLFMHGLITANRFRTEQWALGAENRYRAKVAFLQNPDYQEPEMLSAADAAKIERIFASRSMAKIVVHSYSGRVIHILFDKGFFREYEKGTLGWGDFLLLHVPYTSAIPLPAVWQQEFKRKVFESENGAWQVYAR